MGLLGASGTVVGSLVVMIGANTAGLDKGVKDSKDRMDDLGRGAANLGKALGVLAAAAAAAGVAIVKSSMDAIDAQSKLAARLGTTTADMQGVTRAADLAGISQESLAKIAQRLNATLGAVAREGAGPAYEALQRLGLSASELADLPLSERLATIADSFYRLKLSTSEQADTLKQLGIRGQDLINLFQGGGDSIRNATDEVKLFGIAVSDIDGQRVEQANDAMSVFALTMQGIGNQIAIRLAPLLQGVADEFYNMASEGEGFGSTIDWVIEGVIDMIGLVADTLHQTQREFKALEVVALAVSTDISRGWLLLAGTINNVITTMQDGMHVINSLMNFKLPVFEPDKRTWVDDIIDGVNESEAALAKARTELDNLTTADLPSENLDRWVTAVREKSTAAAEAAVEARRRMVGGDDGEDDGSGGGTEAEAKAAEELQKKLDQQLETFRSSLGDTEASEIESHERRLVQLQDFLERGMITQQEYADMAARAEQGHQEKLTDIAAKQYEIRNRLQRESLSRISSTLDSIGSAMEAAGEDQFGIAKGLAVATALIKGYEAITSSYAAGAAIGGPPVGYAFAALAAVQTAAQIASLRGVTSSSSGTPTVAGGGSPSLPAGGGAAEGGQSQTLFIQGLTTGSLFSGEAVRDLAERMIEYQRDGGKIVLGDA